MSARAFLLSLLLSTTCDAAFYSTADLASPPKPAEAYGTQFLQNVVQPGLLAAAGRDDARDVGVCTTGRGGADNTHTEVCIRKALDFTPNGPKHVCYPVDDKKHKDNKGCPSDMRRVMAEWVYPVFPLCHCDERRGIAWSGERQCVKNVETRFRTTSAPAATPRAPPPPAHRALPPRARLIPCTPCALHRYNICEPKAHNYVDERQAEVASPEPEPSPPTSPEPEPEP